MTSFLYAKGIRIFDYARFAEPLRERIRQRAEQLAAEQGARIEYIAKTHIRKEEVVAKVLAARGEQPGLVHVISAMEACESYKPWHDKASGKTYLRPDAGKCLHYYFYFIDAKLGLCYLRVPTWCPFRLQFYCNGHSWLARKLAAAGIEFTLADNAIVQVADLERAQALADSLTPDELHRRLDHYAERLCPVGEVFGQRYHWSLMQVCLGLLGAYYACTDGVLVAMASAFLPAGLRASGLALLATATGVARFLASVSFGAAWDWWSFEVALVLFVVGLGIAMLLALRALFRLDGSSEHGVRIAR